MKRFLALIMLATPLAGAELVDAVVASVGREPILRSEVIAQAAPYLAELRASATSDAEYQRQANELLDQALQEAVDDKLLLREAQRAGYQAPDEWVDQRLEEVRKLYDSPEAFLKEIEKSGETMTEIRERLRKQALARYMASQKRKEFEQAAVVSESEVAQYYEDNRAKFNRPERVLVYQIFISAGVDEAGRRAARAKIEEIKAELDAGADFGELAKAHSEAPGAEQGGLYGWQARGDLIEPLNSTAFALEEGQVSEVLESPNGFHLLRISGKEAAGLAQLDEVRRDIEPEIRRQKALVKFDEWMRDLRKRSKVRIFEI